MSWSESVEATVSSVAQRELLDIGGSAIELLTEPRLDPSAPALLRDTLPGGAVVPMHAHPQPETFLVETGTMEGLVVTRSGHRWVSLTPGEVFHVPPLARHALRNPGPDTSTQLVVTQQPLVEFFRAIGAPLDSPDGPLTPPDPGRLQSMFAAAARWGYWTASPEENRAVGIDL